MATPANEWRLNSAPNHYITSQRPNSVPSSPFLGRRRPSLSTDASVQKYSARYQELDRRSLYNDVSPVYEGNHVRSRGYSRSPTIPAENFLVAIDNPVMFAGDRLSGQIILDALTKSMLLSLTIRIHGSSLIRTRRKPTKQSAEDTDIYLDEYIPLVGGIVSPAMVLMPGRYTFPFEFHLPAELSPTADIFGTLKETNEFSLMNKYFAQSKLVIAHQSTDGSRDSIDMISERSFFRVENSQQRLVSSVVSKPINMGSNSNSAVIVQLDRSVLQPGETVIVKVFSDRRNMFYSADAYLVRHLKIPLLNTDETTPLNKVIGCRFIRNDSPNMNHGSVCLIEIPLAHDLDPESNLKLLNLNYFIEVRTVYKGNRKATITIPFHVVSAVRHQNGIIDKTVPPETDLSISCQVKHVNNACSVS